MAGSSHRSGQPITGINVTPLVDVMLVLLIIFMVTANYINSQAIKVELPEAATGESVGKATNLGFVIDAESKLYLDGKPVSFENLPKLIQTLKSENSAGVQALIGADKESKHGIVIKLIDTLRKNGVNDFAFNIEAEQ